MTSGPQLEIVTRTDPTSPVPAQGSSSRSATPLTGRYSKADEGRADTLFDRARHGIHCSLFCGGVRCKHEDWQLFTTRKNVHPAIEGLNSNWVGDLVIASQRPATSLFLKYMLIPQFKAKNVTGVFNLQEKGEHASCGPDGIYATTGYSYSGEQDLMRHGVRYYEFPWPDMTAPDNDIVLRSVQVMDSHVQSGSGKVLVHCHAGLGRTGLLIACYFVYAHRMTSADAIRLVRLSRPGAVQTASQAAFVRGFESHLWDLMRSFRVEIQNSRIELELFMKRQRTYLHGEEGSRYRYLPKMLHVVLCRLVCLCRRHKALSWAALDAMAPSATPSEETLKEFCVQLNRAPNYASCVNDVPMLACVAVEWFRRMSAPVISEHTASEIVAFMKEMDPEGNHREEGGSGNLRLMEFVHSHLERVARHVIGCLVSALYLLHAEVQQDSLIRSACRFVAEALTQTHAPLKNYLTPFQREMVTDFFMEWTMSIKGRYFDPSLVRSSEHRIVAQIAALSADVSATMSASVMVAPIDNPLTE